MSEKDEQALMSERTCSGEGSCKTAKIRFMFKKYTHELKPAHTYIEAKKAIRVTGEKTAPALKRSDKSSDHKCIFSKA